MPVSEIHHVAMIVSDLDRSTDFYSRGLGYRPTLRANVGGVGLETAIGLPEGVHGRIQYLQGPTQIGQMELIEWADEEPLAARRDHRQLGPLLLSYESPRDELEGLLAGFIDLGAEVVSGFTVTTLENFGEIAAFSVRDPDGIQIEIVALPSLEERRAYRRGTSESDDE